jgi:hypothetical protein
MRPSEARAARKAAKPARELTETQREARRRRPHREHKTANARDYRIRRAMGLTARHWSAQSHSGHTEQWLIGKAAKSLGRRLIRRRTP